MSAEVGIGSVEIDASDVVRLVIQFLKEHGLSSSAAEVEKESGILCNAVEGRERLLSDIRSGKWESVLPALRDVELPKEASLEVYEHVCLELCEANEAAAARELLRSGEPLRSLRAEHPDRYVRLEKVVASCARAGGYEGAGRGDVWPRGESRESRRRAVADEVERSVGDVAPNRLVTLLGQALRWRVHAGSLRGRGGQRVDVFRGDVAARARAEEEKPPRKAAGSARNRRLFYLSKGRL